MVSNELPTDFLESLKSVESSDSIAEELRNALPQQRTAKNDAKSLQKLLELARQLERTHNESGSKKWFTAESGFGIETLPKHKAFFDAGATYPERLFMAGNRVGKSIAGAYELACHLTGDYPFWWAGKVFDHPILAWAVGKDARAVRDTAQKELLGPIGQWGTGMIPANKFGKCFALQGTPQAIDVILIKHKSGGWSELGFKNYQQDIGSFMGTSRHAIWLDEECPLEIYNECNIRTATTGGIMLVTFTPLDGLTKMVVNFCKKADFLVGAKPIVSVEQDLDDVPEHMRDGDYLIGSEQTKAVIQAGWDDASWLDEKTKARLLEDTPVHLREARSKGLPAMGSGNVYPVPIEEVLCDTFAIPASWPRMYALDVGWNRTAAIWGALDPATDTLYLYDEHYLGQELPAVHAYAIRSRGDWMIGVIDPAARGRSPSDGQKLVQMYKDLGLTLFPAKNEVESGISLITQRLVARKIKVFKTLVNFQKEYILYARDKNGKVVKENDHLLDCLRYIVNNMQRMSSKSEHASYRSLPYVASRYQI